MLTGMMWFDNKGDLNERIQRAIDYYEAKYGRKASVIQVNIDEIKRGQTPTWFGEVRVDASYHMTRNHYLVGQLMS